MQMTAYRECDSLRASHGLKDRRRSTLRQSNTLRLDRFPCCTNQELNRIAMFLTTCRARGFHDEMNGRLNTVLVAPLTKIGFSAPFRVPCQFAGVKGQIALDHVRSVDKRRLARKLGDLDATTSKTMLATLREMFEE